MTKFNNGESIRDEGHRIVNEMRDTRVQRERADAKREGFFELHQRQKETFATQADRLDNFESNASTTINSLVRLRTYVMLTDPHLGPFINEARMKARTAYLTGTRNWHHHYVHDVADVDIKLTGRSVYIRIIPADEFYAEFATSAHPIVVDGSGTYPTYEGCIVGVRFGLRNGSVQLKPTIREQRRSIHGNQLSLVERQFQIQLTDEPVNYPQGKLQFGRWRYTTTLFGTYAPGHSHTGIQLRNTTGPSSTFSGYMSPGPLGTYTFRDIDYDVPFQKGVKADPIKTAYIRGAADWPRKSGMQVVETEWGPREFGIWLDAFNQFAIFPTSKIGPLSLIDSTLQNVDDAFVRRIVPTFPAWVHAPTVAAKDYWATNPNISEWVIDQPELDWRFNHLSTKACAIAYERVPYTNETAYWNTDQNPDTPWNDTKFSAYADRLGVEFTAQMIDPNTYEPQRYFTAPGVVEATITITVSGPGENEFDATVTIAEVKRPTTDYAMPVFAGYVWHDIPSSGQSNTDAPSSQRIARSGDLIIAYLEYWVRPQGADGTEGERAVIWSIRKAADGTEVLSYPRYPMLALDFATLSFVFMVQHMRREKRNVSLRTGAPGAPRTDSRTFSVREFGAWIVTMGESRDILFPESLTQDAKDRLTALTELTGRADINARIAAQGSDPWYLVPMSSAKDGWVDSGYNNYRDWWAYQNHYFENDFFVAIDSDYTFYGDYVKYKIKTPPLPSLDASGQAARKELNALDGSHQHLLFCDDPRWNWHAYAGVLQTMMYKHHLNTFFAHPNGSYAFWDAGWLFDNNGVIGNAGAGYGDDEGSDGTSWYYNTLTPYDESLIEHVIFDTVCFQMRTTKKVLAKRKTSFLELYNRAVAAGKAAETLESGIDEVTYADMKATFTKEIAAGPNYDFLDLKATWIGTDWWFSDEGVTGEPFHTFPYFAGTSGNMFGLNLWQYWRITNYAGAGVSRVPGFPEPSDTDVWNYRFANMLIIMEK